MQYEAAGRAVTIGSRSVTCMLPGSYQDKKLPILFIINTIQYIYNSRLPLFHIKPFCQNYFTIYSLRNYLILFHTFHLEKVVTIPEIPFISAIMVVTTVGTLGNKGEQTEKINNGSCWFPL